MTAGGEDMKAGLQLADSAVRLVANSILAWRLPRLAVDCPYSMKAILGWAKAKVAVMG